MQRKLTAYLLICLASLCLFSGCAENRLIPADNLYQLICVAPDRTHRLNHANHGNDSILTNKYAGYTFTVTDALNWLKQTNGNITFVLEVRDLEAISDERVIETGIEYQKNIINCFKQAYDSLKQSEPRNKTLKMPRFYIGTPEENSIKGIEIYEGIISDFPNEWIEGIFFAGEGPEDLDKHIDAVSEFIHKKGKKLLWIPYFNSKGDFFEIARKADIGLTDITIMQVGYFYREFDEIKGENDLLLYQREASIYKSMEAGRFLWVEDPNNWDVCVSASEKSDFNIGVQFEYDNSLFTGRTIKSSSTPAEKVDYFNQSLEKFKPFIGSKTIGIYTGGVSEQGYNDININKNPHNIYNYIPANYDSKTNFHGSGTLYNEFGVTYDGNLMYDIFNELFINRSDFEISLEENEIKINKKE